MDQLFKSFFFKLMSHFISKVNKFSMINAKIQNLFDRVVKSEKTLPIRAPIYGLSQHRTNKQFIC